jgi:hypothetical protein
VTDLWFLFVLYLSCFVFNRRTICSHNRIVQISTINHIRVITVFDMYAFFSARNRTGTSVVAF